MGKSATWFITGASRGIGLELTRQLVYNSNNVVIASCRNPVSASALAALKSGSASDRLHIVQLDVTAEDTITRAAEVAKEILNEKGLDYLLNNAAVNPENDGAFDFSSATFSSVMLTNVIGPAAVTRNFLPLLKQGNRKVIMNMTSGLASIGLDIGSKCCTYSMSKAALNMLTYKQAREDPELTVVCVDPGWVKTELGGEGAILEPEESVAPLVAFLTVVNKEHSGKFFNNKGEVLPW